MKVKNAQTIRWAAGYVSVGDFVTIETQYGFRNGKVTKIATNYIHVETSENFTFKILNPSVKVTFSGKSKLL